MIYNRTNIITGISIIMIIIIIGVSILPFTKQITGIHYIIDINNIPNHIILNNDKLIHMCDEIVKKIKINVINKSIHHFKPVGLTALYLLAESHLSIHTWPEHNCVRMDLFSCGNTENTKKIIPIIQSFFEKASINIIKLYR